MQKGIYSLPKASDPACSVKTLKDRIVPGQPYKLLQKDNSVVRMARLILTISFNN